MPGIQKWIRSLCAALACLCLLCACGAQPETGIDTSQSEMESQKTATSPAFSSPFLEKSLRSMSGRMLQATVDTFDAPSVCAYAVEFSKTQPRPGEEWYTLSRLIYHACGVVGSAEYTNSREALEATLSAGNRLVEIDFLFTSDGHLVCAHEWDDVFGYARSCTLAEFLAQKIRGQYSGMTAEDIIVYMAQYPDLHVIIDTKEPDAVTVVAELLRLCYADPEIANRFVIQLYDRGIKAQMLELYPFWDENFLFTAYKFGPERISEIRDLCREENIRVITMPFGSWGQATVEQFVSEEYILFEHTVNFSTMAESSLKRGIYGFYTDYLQETDLPVIE